MNRFFKKTLSLMLVIVMTVSLGVSAAAADQTGAAQAEGPLGIVSAMSVELNALVEATKISKTEEIAGNTFYEGVLNGVDVVLVKAGIGKVLAVASGKGGVGKSTVTANLAVALRNMGFRVGILDADIYGPSQPKMFNVEEARPYMVEVGNRELIEPAANYGVKLLSIGFFVNKEDAVLWRGAMASNALKQLIGDANWGDLDYFLIDLPPGTSDIHLTMVQTLAITGAIVVSTPQEVALADARKGISMFMGEKINVPVLGLVENMSWFTPAELPENKYYLFGKEGGKRLAEELNIPLLGQIPIVQSICEGGDNGKPVALNPDSITGQAFQKLAENVVKQIDYRNEHLDPTRRVQVTHK